MEFMKRKKTFSYSAHIGDQKKQMSPSIFIKKATTQKYQKSIFRES